MGFGMSIDGSEKTRMVENNILGRRSHKGKSRGGGWSQRVEKKTYRKTRSELVTKEREGSKGELVLAERAQCSMHTEANTMA